MINKERGIIMKQELINEYIKKGRDFVRPNSNIVEDEHYETDQEQKKPQPPLVKEAMTSHIIELPKNFSDLPIQNDFLSIINQRQSHRIYSQETMNLLQLSYLLWCTQGVKEIRGRAYATLRTVPSGGARHPFETYLAIQNVEGLKNGYYHYLPMEHQLELIQEKEDIKEFISASVNGQGWAMKANVVFYYSFVPYRAEWRYGIYAHRIVLVDAGHVTENLYLSSQSIGLGGCAIGAVNGTLCDQVFGLDGENEYIFYAHTIGTISAQDKEKENDLYRFVKEQNL